MPNTQNNNNKKRVAICLVAACIVSLLEPTSTLNSPGPIARTVLGRHAKCRVPVTRPSLSCPPARALVSPKRRQLAPSRPVCQNVNSLVPAPASPAKARRRLSRNDVTTAPRVCPRSHSKRNTDSQIGGCCRKRDGDVRDKPRGKKGGTFRQAWPT